MNTNLMPIWYTIAYMHLVVIRHVEGCQVNLLAFSLLLIFSVIFAFLTEAVVCSGQWGTIDGVKLQTVASTEPK